ncbi:hypothetical protein Lser_V15G19433 [Lactuca serriola]
MLIQIGRVLIYDNGRPMMWERDMIFGGVQTELIFGDQNGNIHVWDLTANSCSCEMGTNDGYGIGCFL